MSNRQLTATDVRFEPVLEPKPQLKQEPKLQPEPQPKPQPPSPWLLALGVFCPALAIGTELATRMCAQSFFDPMPTWGHVAAIAFVPLSNFVIWMHLEHGRQWSIKGLVFAQGIAIAIASIYALLFLPLAPIAFVAILVGIGLLPLAPLAAFICALKLRTALARTRPDLRLGRPLLGGLAAGLVLLVALDVPPSVTRIGIRMAASDVPAERERGLMLLRTFGDDDLLLRLCYEMARQPTGLLSSFATLRSQPMAAAAAGRCVSRHRARGLLPAARRAVQRPAGADDGDAHRIRHSGSTPTTAARRSAAGCRGSRSPPRASTARSAATTSSPISNGRSNSATPPRSIARRGCSSRCRPARVVSRATLWVNGEEREAAYGGRGEVRAAYQRVAVIQRRDPLLVTTKGADRVLAQAFPVGRSGGTIKFKIGITAPLDINESGKARLTLPAIVDRNFSFGPNTSHGVWIESRQLMTTSLPELAASPVGALHYRVSGALSDRALSGLRQTITVERNPDAGPRSAHFEDGERVVQEIARGEPTGALMLVIDGSARVAGTRSRADRGARSDPARRQGRRDRGGGSDFNACRWRPGRTPRRPRSPS